MKKLAYFLMPLLLLMLSCKKDSVDATNTRTFQASINDMATRLNTLQQVKFNEALYILKTFGVQGETDQQELANLGQMLNGKKVPEIMALADQVAQRNGIAWTSTGPPSLGEMNIFGDETPSEFDANDVKASGVSITATPVAIDSILGPKAIQIVPRLVDRQGKQVDFSGAALETVIEVYSGGNRILTSKNLMQDNKFKGFSIRMASLPREKVKNGVIDVTISVKASKKTYKMTKVGIPINTRALLMPQVAQEDTGEGAGNGGATVIVDDVIQGDNTQASSPAGDPKNTVSGFLGNLRSQNFKGAYGQADNPSWGSYEAFANPTSGFGGVKNINVKNISTKNISGNSASVNATYDVTDKDGKVTALQVTFGLKNVNGDWKISSYQIN